MLSFTRKLHSFGPRCRDLSKYVDATKNVPRLKGTPNIYNHKASAANYKGVLKAKIPAGLYYYPAQSSATGSINSETIPKAFLPKDDPRRQFVNELRHESAEQSKLAPVLHNKIEKSYHLKPQQIEEIVMLRKEDPVKYTRKALAKKYNVSPLFISLVSSASQERKSEMQNRLNLIKESWHIGRTLAREDRKKRKSLWYRA